MSSVVAGEYELLDRYPYGSDPVWPVTLEDLKLHIQLDHSAEDALLAFGNGGWLASATQEIEARGQVSLIQQKRRVLLDELPSETTIELGRGPVTAITIVKYLDSDGAEQTLASAYYRGQFKGKARGIYFKNTSAISVDNGPGTVWIDYVAGLGTIPDAIPAQWRTLVAALACHMYERRELVAGGGIDPAFEAVIDRKCILAGAKRRYV
jgi:uncharacterized phiE125 gp8 family phage protein